MGLKIFFNFNRDFSALDSIVENPYYGIQSEEFKPFQRSIVQVKEEEKFSCRRILHGEQKINKLLGVRVSIRRFQQRGSISLQHEYLHFFKY